MKKGYSLLEVIIYLAILGIVAAVVIESILFVYKTFALSRVERKLNINGDSVIETIVRASRTAAGVDDPASIMGSSPGVLKVGGATFSLTGAGGIVQADYGAGAEPITTDVSADSLFFYKEATTTSEIIKIEISLSAGDGAYRRTKNFYGSAVLRGKY